MEKAAISVQIYNEIYVLHTSAPQTKVLQIAQSVDERIKLAVWTALDLAAELDELQERYNKLLAAVRER